MSSNKYFEFLDQYFSKHGTIGTKQQLQNCLNDNHYRLWIKPNLLAQNLIESNIDLMRSINLLETYHQVCDTIFKAGKKLGFNEKVYFELYRFYNASAILSEVLRSSSPSAKQLFQQSVFLSQQLDAYKSDWFIKNAATNGLNKGYRKGIKNSWLYLQKLLEKHDISISGDPDYYFKRFESIVDDVIEFPAVFVWDWNSITKGYNEAKVENCWLWLDVDSESEFTENEPVNPISINYQKDIELEDRAIGSAIRKGIKEAVRIFNSKQTKDRKAMVRESFFRIGDLGDNYDGESIGAASFFATLTCLYGQSIPTHSICTGIIGHNNKGVAGIVEKAKAAYEAKAKIFIVPSENYKKAEKHKSDYPELNIIPYQSIQDLFKIWKNLVDKKSIQDILEDGISDDEIDDKPVDSITDTIGLNSSIELAEKYFYGVGCDRDYQKAVKHYRTLARNGDSRASYKYGYMLIYGLGITRDEARGLEYIKSSSNESYIDSLLMLGNIYLENERVLQEKLNSKHFETTNSFKYLKKAAELGSIEASTRLGEIYSIIDENEIETAKNWLKIPVQRDSAEACYLLSKILLNEESSEEKEKKAIGLLSRAANQRYSKAELKMGDNCLNSDCVKPQIKAATSWYYKAAEQGNPEAFIKLGLLYISESKMKSEDDFVQVMPFIKNGIELTSQEQELGKGWVKKQVIKKFSYLFSGYFYLCNDDKYTFKEQNFLAPFVMILNEQNDSPFMYFKPSSFGSDVVIFGVDNFVWVKKGDQKIACEDKELGKIGKIRKKYKEIENIAINQGDTLFTLLSFATKKIDSIINSESYRALSIPYSDIDFRNISENENSLVIGEYTVPFFGIDSKDLSLAAILLKLLNSIDSIESRNNHIELFVDDIINYIVELGFPENAVKIPLPDIFDRCVKQRKDFYSVLNKLREKQVLHNIHDNMIEFFTR